MSVMLKYLQGRPMGGVSVFVRQSISSYITRVCEEFEFGIILRIDKALFGLTSDCVYCAVYFPPADSPFYQNINQPAWKVLEDTLIGNDLINLNLILNGDFNSRTGHESDRIENVPDNIPELQ